MNKVLKKGDLKMDIDPIDFVNGVMQERGNLFKESMDGADPWRTAAGFRRERAVRLFGICMAIQASRHLTISQEQRLALNSYLQACVLVAFGGFRVRGIEAAVNRWMAAAHHDADAGWFRIALFAPDALEHAQEEEIPLLYPSSSPQPQPVAAE